MRTSVLRTIGGPIAILLAALALVVGSAAFRVGASDHLDAPTVRADGRIDINDLYVFQGHNASHTVLAMTVDPAAGILSPTSFRPGALYQFNISTNGDTIPEIAYRVKFGGIGSKGTQHVSVHRADGASKAASGAGGKAIGSGTSYQTINLAGGGWAWAGLRDDPFFFDLDAFKHFKATLLAGGGLADLGGLVNCSRTNPKPTDFFLGFNAMAIVLEVPDSALGSGTIKVWANTLVDENGQLTQVDRVGLPGINTIFNHTDATKEAYNRANPKNDVANYTGAVAGVVNLVTTLAGTNVAGYPAAIAAALLPDVLTYNTATPANFNNLNGRTLSNDVIDKALTVVANTTLTDCVPNDSTFLPSFPYLGVPN
ncbi:MAG: DUF4331 family protein [Chloroflexota bacterium]